MTLFAETAAGVLFEKERTSPRRQKWLNEAALLYVGPGPGAEGGFKINLHLSCVGFRGSDSGRVGAGSAGVSTCLLFGCNQSLPLSPRREWTTIWLLYQLAGEALRVSYAISWQPYNKKVRTVACFPPETKSSRCMHESGIARVRVWFQGEEQRPMNLEEFPVFFPLNYCVACTRLCVCSPLPGLQFNNVNT